MTDALTLDNLVKNLRRPAGCRRRLAWRFARARSSGWWDPTGRERPPQFVWDWTSYGPTQAQSACSECPYPGIPWPVLDTMPEERGLYQRAKVTSILTYLARLKRLDKSAARARADELLTRVGLYEHRGKKVSALSRGMSQLVQFAGALMHKPDSHHPG